MVRTLEDVAYVPGLVYNIFSLTAMAEFGYEGNISTSGATVFEGDFTFARSGGGLSALGYRGPYALVAPVLTPGLAATPKSCG